MKKETLIKINELLDLVDECVYISDCHNSNCEAYGYIERDGKLFKSIIKFIVNNLDVEKLKDELMIEEI